MVMIICLCIIFMVDSLNEWIICRVEICKVMLSESFVSCCYVYSLSIYPFLLCSF